MQPVSKAWGIRVKGIPGGSVVKNPPASAGDDERHRFRPWVRKLPCRKKQHPTPVFLPGKSRGQRSLAGSRPRDHKSVRHA